jgi:hypothetical protein
MGFDLSAFLGRVSELRTWKRKLRAAVVCELSGELGLVPATGQLLGEMRARLSQEEITRLDSAPGARRSPAPSEEEGLRRWMADASAGTAVAYVSIGEFGDDGWDNASLWSDGRELLQGTTLLAVLDHFQNQAGINIGSKSIDLGRHRGDDAAERWAAEAVLEELTSKAETPLPALTAALQHEGSSKYISTLVRKFAADSLAKFGPAAKEAIPALIQSLRTEADFGICLATASALAAIGADAVPALTQVLTDGEVREIERTTYGKLYPTVRALSKIGPAARMAVPALVRVLGDANRSVREEAVETLGVIGPDASGAVVALMGVLTDPEWAVRTNAARALGQIGKAAEVAITALQKALDDTNQFVRKAAGEAIANIKRAT